MDEQRQLACRKQDMGEKEMEAEAGIEPTYTDLQSGA